MSSMSFQHIYKQFTTGKSVFYAWFEAMHTRVDVAFCNLPEASSMSLMQKLKAEIDRIEKLANRFDTESEISRVNQFAGIEPFKVNEELYAIIKDCVSYNKETDGAFDITIQSENNHRNGIFDIVLDPIAQTVFFENRNVRIDLCGYAKGYALDKLKYILEENSCHDALISIGCSSVLALGNHLHGKGWKVSLPGKDKEDVILFDECLTTSGNTKQHPHIIDPETGKCSKSMSTTISVITNNGTEGEVLSTALCVCDARKYNLGWGFRSYKKEVS